MELVGEGAAWASVSGDQSLHGFHRNFGPAVCMGVVCRRYSMVHSPVGQEGPGGVGGEFWAAVRRKCVRYPEG